MLRNLPERAARIFAESDRDFDSVVLRLLGIISFRPPSTFFFSSSFSLNFLVDRDNENGNKNNNEFNSLSNKMKKENNELDGSRLKSMSQVISEESSTSTYAALLIYLESRLEVLGGTRAFESSVANKVSVKLEEINFINKYPDKSIFVEINLFYFDIILFYLSMFYFVFLFHLYLQFKYKNNNNLDHYVLRLFLLTYLLTYLLTDLLSTFSPFFGPQFLLSFSSFSFLVQFLYI